MKIDRFSAEKRAHLAMLSLLISEADAEQARGLWRDLMEQLHHCAAKLPEPERSSAIQILSRNQKMLVDNRRNTGLPSVTTG